MPDNLIQQLQVLLVEPSHTQQLIINKYLQNAGLCNIQIVASGAEAIQAIKRRPPDLIISAMYLPDMNGDKLVYAIRNEPGSYDMVFMLISSETHLEYLEPIRQAGAIGILPKPFSQTELDIALKATFDYLHPVSLDAEGYQIEDISVLLVDDSPFSLKFTQRILEDMGIVNVTLAKDGAEALQILNSKYFDLVITDFNMPKVDGLQLINHVKSDIELRSVPILMLTSEQNQARLSAVKQAGVSAILDKPFEPNLIKNLIIRLLN